MKKDIETMTDIQLLVDNFYDKVNKDEMLSPIFNEVAKVNWEKHMPIMYKFWASTLLGEQGYVGNPMDAHFRLNEKRKLEGENFSRWKSLFVETVNELFEGEIANRAKKSAFAIADLMFYKLQNYEQSAGVNIGEIRRQ
ncbi:sec-independent protein translocase protein TatC [Pseudopedobacter saltans DSM 12145]|uniref:Sec-independent protein translocase protein TatC n=1 Tax=Pseudopedobacter saltans (strain ATCC 51119 / DSM 12145 / JCM 21818 / CCUG 39354 / LMG 10337 / NBRC 100064 / NCIMB 13643) TaxID=762903 RepID=F0SDM7_PSESL|nr:group III truncated hemoglobin [Pseudopedobacter saltans]ADY50754.1 sec-independent protein translocase protein TatC [Pseudopedobacter saltans DSM 12145]